MARFILILNGKPIKSFTYLSVANRYFDKFLKTIDPLNDSLELWSRSEGVVRLFF